MRRNLRTARPGEAKTGYEVVMGLMDGLHGRGHVVVTDNFFTSPKLLVDLHALGTYGTGTVRANRIGLPSMLVDKKRSAKELQESMGWMMHCIGELCAVVWVDKKPVLLLSTHAEPLSPDPSAPVTVPRYANGRTEQVPTSPVHLEYTTKMRCVDVSDQLRGVYTTLTKSHKWWHRLFMFLLDTAVTNAWVIHKHECEQLGRPSKTHLDFIRLLAYSLMSGWQRDRCGVVSIYNSNPGTHSLDKVRGGRHQCHTCKSKRYLTNLLCRDCGNKWYHTGECHRKAHFARRR